MEFLYLTLLIIAAFVILYIIGFILAFCIMFFGFSDHNKEYLVEDLVYSLGSWLSILFVLLCWVLGREEEKANEQNYCD